MFKKKQIKMFEICKFSPGYKRGKECWGIRVDYYGQALDINVFERNVASVFMKRCMEQVLER